MELTGKNQLRFEIASRAFAKAVEDKFIRNAEYNYAKDNLNRAFYDVMQANDARFGMADEYRDIYYWYPATHAALGFQKKLHKIVEKHGHNEYTQYVDDVITFFTPVIENMKASKAFIVKGRKPSENATPARTLENTGTCSVCGKNVKLRNGNIVDHGFEVPWNGFGRVGQCFGVGFKPIEVSSEGVTAYLVYVDQQLNQKIELLERHKNDEFEEIFLNRKSVKKEDPKFKKYQNVIMANIEGDIRHINHIKETFETKLKNWQPGVLPG